jgi:plasmid stabilization system protein ParE
MIYKIVVEPEVLEDLFRIKKYITDQDSLNKANKFISELKLNIQTLSEMPQRCRKSYYSDRPDTHDFIYKKYTTVFQIRKSKIHILSIFRQRSY